MRRLLIALALLSLVPAAAGAGMELTLTGGYRWGEAELLTEDTTSLIVCVTTPCVLATGRAGASEVVGLILDVPIAPGWMFEALLNRQDGDVDFPGTQLPRETYESTTAQVGVQRYWERERWTPFAALGLGVTRWQTTALVYRPPLFPGIGVQRLDDEVFSGSIAGGVKVPLSARFGLRLEGRYYHIDLPHEVSGSFGQTEAAAGLTFRF